MPFILEAHDVGFFSVVATGGSPESAGFFSVVAATNGGPAPVGFFGGVVAIGRHCTGSTGSNYRVYLTPEASRWHTLPIGSSVRSRDEPLVLLVQHQPSYRPCPVILEREGMPARILGEEVPGPYGVAYAAVDLLIQIYPGGISAQQLNFMTGAKDARAALRELVRRDERWGRVLRFPGVRGGLAGKRAHYRIENPAA